MGRINLAVRTRPAIHWVELSACVLIGADCWWHVGILQAFVFQLLPNSSSLPSYSVSQRELLCK